MRRVNVVIALSNICPWSVVFDWYNTFFFVRRQCKWGAWRSNSHWFHTGVSLKKLRYQRFVQPIRFNAVQPIRRFTRYAVYTPHGIIMKQASEQHWLIDKLGLPTFRDKHQRYPFILSAACMCALSWRPLIGGPPWMQQKCYVRYFYDKLLWLSIPLATSCWSHANLASNENWNKTRRCWSHASLVVATNENWNND